MARIFCSTTDRVSFNEEINFNDYSPISAHFSPILQINEIISVSTKPERVQCKDIVAGIAEDKEFAIDPVDSAAALAWYRHHGTGSSLDWTARQARPLCSNSSRGFYRVWRTSTTDITLFNMKNIAFLSNLFNTYKYIN